jgi:predicted Zn finger-like uncharacterized protein
MPEQVRCPSCNATLRVPETLLGKNVKCPKCQNTFLAEMEGQTQAEEIVQEPARVARRPPSREEEEEEVSVRPRGRAAEREDEEEEYEERPRRRGRRRSAAAASMVAGPAISMMVAAGLSILISILDVFGRLLGLGIYAAGQDRSGEAAGVAGNLAVGISGDILGIALAVLILVGALKMKSLSSYGLAMTACIVSMVPCHACCCLGLPFGIWGLVVLNKPEVKDAFS